MLNNNNVLILFLQQRDILAAKNSVTLKWVESALFVVSLEMEAPKVRLNILF